MDFSVNSTIVEILRESIQEGYSAYQVLTELCQNAFFDFFLEPLDLSNLTVENEENLKNILQEVKDSSNEEVLTDEELSIWYILLVEALWGSDQALTILEPMRDSWKNHPRILYKFALMEFYEKQYDEAKSTIELALEIDDPTFNDEYELFPMKILYASLLTEKNEFAKAEEIYLQINDTLDELIETQDAKNKYYKLIYTFHTTYATYHYVRENYEQTVYLLERLSHLYGNPHEVLDDEFITILAQCYEFLGQNDLRDNLIKSSN